MTRLSFFISGHTVAHACDDDLPGAARVVRLILFSCFMSFESAVLWGRLREQSGLIFSRFHGSYVAPLCLSPFD